MNANHISKIASELSLKETQVLATMILLEDGSTVPFIARYRKEATGTLDEVAIAAIRDRVEQLTELDKRREAILKSLTELNKLTPELEKAVNATETLAQLEDLYLPYRPKRKTRATVAKDKGLEPLALALLEQGNQDPDEMAQGFVSEEKQVGNAAEALAGARDIIAEMINENAEVRGKLREIFTVHGKISSKVIKGQEELGAKFKDYYEWEEPLATIPSHRLLAILRGRNEGFLLMKMTGVEEQALAAIRGLYLKNGGNKASEQVGLAIDDSFKRLLLLSLEVETVVQSKKKADEQAITVFAENLRELLLAAPLGPKRILALDPGFRTGCKVVCLDAQGKLLINHTIYPHPPQNEFEKAGKEITALVKKFEIQAIAIGNGTAGRETEEFARSLNLAIPIIVVNESGASIYSASDVAREEFPDFDITVRGAVSIGRRLLDPLAELVKIDPKSIGVGQYQHDVNQKLLKQSLDDVVMSCVNAVGVDVNTASKQILTYVSGLGPKLAESVVVYRNEHGAFHSREELKKVARLTGKAFEQAAAFLRIPNAVNPLDRSAVHPERYDLVTSMAGDLDCTVERLIQDKQLREKVDVRKYVSESVGLPTLNDILQELDKPGRDPRKQFEIFSFAEGINTMEDLKSDMLLPGIVTNVTAFGAFVDIGVHQDGLVHVSELSDTYVKDPKDVVKVSQQVKVKVLDVDLPRRRIALSMKTGRGEAPTPRPAGEKRGPGSGQNQSNQQPQPKSDWQKQLMELKKKI
jgi:uncharacterized protein